MKYDNLIEIILLSCLISLLNVNIETHVQRILKLLYPQKKERALDLPQRFFSKDKKDCSLKYCVNESLYNKQDFAHTKWNNVFFLHGTVCTMAQHLILLLTGFDRHTDYCWLQVKTVIQEVSGFAG